MVEFNDYFVICEHKERERLHLVEEEPLLFEWMRARRNRGNVDPKTIDCYRTRLYTKPLLPFTSALLPVCRLVDDNGNRLYSVFTTQAALNEWLGFLAIQNPWYIQVVNVLGELGQQELDNHLWYEAVSRVAYMSVEEKYKQKLAEKEKIDKQKINENNIYIWDLTLDEFIARRRKSGDLQPKRISDSTRSLLERFLDSAFIKGYLAIQYHPVDGESYWLPEIQYQGHGYSPLPMCGMGGIEFIHEKRVLYFIMSWVR